MGTHPPEVTVANLTLDYQTGLILAHYPRKVAEIRALEQEIERADAFISHLRHKLPDTQRVEVHTQSRSPDQRNPSLTIPTTVYRRTPDLEWYEFAQVVTSGGVHRFFGTDGFMSEAGCLVITDHESGWGMSVTADSSGVRLIDLNDDPYKGTIGGPWSRIHRATIAFFAALKPGLNRFDYSWY